MDLTQLVQLLAQLLDAGEKRKIAEISIENAKKTSPNELAVALALILKNNNIDPQTRLMASSVLRNQINQCPLESSTLSGLKSHIIEALEHTDDRQVLRQVCEVASSLAGTVFSEDDKWEELLALFVKWSTSPIEIQRESTFKILSELLYTLTTEFNFFFETLQGLLLEGLKDQSMKVRCEVLNGAIHFLVLNASSRAAFEPFVPNMFEIIRISLNDNDEDTAHQAMELLITLAECKPEILSQYIDNIFEIMLTLATTNPRIDERIRFSAVEFLVSYCEAKPGTVRKKTPELTKFISILLLMMTKITDNPNWNLGDQSDCDDEERDIGGESLDRTALSIGSSIVPIIFRMIPTMLQSENWKHRHAALMAISVVGEGCVKVLTPNLDRVMQLIFPLFQDPHERVRWAACNSVGQLATDFSPIFQMRYHSQVLQSLIMVMDDQKNPRVQSHAAAAVINFCDNCDTELLEPYLQNLLAKLASLLQDNLLVLEQAFTAIAAVADCVKEKFIPFYDSFMPYFKSFLILESNSQEVYKLRGKAMEAISIFAVAVGKEKFMPDARFVLDAMLTIQEAISKENDHRFDEISSFLQLAWARLCKAMGQDFVPYLSSLVPKLLESASLKADLRVLDDSTEVDDSWQRIGGEGKKLGINNAVLNEKRAAITMIYWLVEELNEGFFMYVDKLAPICVASLGFVFDPDIRSVAASIIPHLLRSTKTYMELHNSTLAPLHQLFQFIIVPFLEALNVEVEQEVLYTFLDALQESIAIAGTGCLTLQQLNPIQIISEKLLDSFLVNRNNLEKRLQSVELDKDDREKLDVVFTQQIEVLAKVSELVGKSIRVTGEPSIPIFSKILAVYQSFLGENARPKERQTSVGIFNEIVEFGGQSALRIYQQWIPYVVNCLGDVSLGVQLVAARAMGVLAEHSPNVFRQILPDVLNRLSALIAHKDARIKPRILTTETAIASVGKIILFHPTQVDLQQVLPIWLNYLPVTEDPKISQVVYQELCSFFQHTEILLGENYSNLPRILGIFSDVLGTNHITPETHQTIILILKRMESQFPQQLMQSAWESLNPNQQHKLQQILTS